MKTSKNEKQTMSNEEPAIFTLQTERGRVVPNERVSSYEEKLGAELGVSPEDLFSCSAGTTTPNADSKED
jgi:hypothetical protein